MAMRVVWTEQANRAIDFIFTCSQGIYGRTLLKKLRHDVQSCELLIRDNPLMGALEIDAPSIGVEFRHIILTSPFKLVYFIEDDIIYIADIWDTRQKPEQLLDRISNM